MTAPMRTRVAGLFGALANETRLRIVEYLLSGPKTVSQISRDLHLQQSSASQHLAILTRSGLLKVVPNGTFRVYSLRGPRIPKILEIMEDFCNVHGLQEVSSGDEEPEDSPLD